MSNLLRAFPEKTEAERKSIARRFYRNFTDNFIEAVKLVSASPSFINRHFKGDYTVLNKAYEEGKNCQVLLSHNFNWEMGCLSAALHVKHVFIVVYMPIANKVLDRIFMKMRTKTGAVLLPKDDFKKALQPYRNQKHTIALVADQNPSNPRNAYWLNFFGKPTPFVRGPERGARRTNNSVVFCKILKEKRGYYRFILETEIVDPSLLNEGEITKRYVEYLSNFMREQPEMWLWSHRRWKWDWKPEYGEIIQ